ncbi:PAS domain S-box-containing protein [Dyadobacter koreensis]|uniref:PAS domain S-box-containing protein n=1 Tax=Dyadobacter koreensis TaxID=408657 RepID=A0A1H6QG78_9BACT|nr:helix-turn-helix domain-containing protein [Dyadobacter koreensis]SEI38265.1 PAS domain S-box-containing protein [Dyadobacter koreensis]
MDLNLPDTTFDLEYFYELSPDLLCVAGYDGYFKKINPAVSKTLGYSLEELMSRPINSFVHPDDRNVTNDKRESIKTNKPLLNFENRYLTKYEEVVWLSWTSMPIERDQVVFAIAKNITYRKKLQELRRISDSLGLSAEIKEIFSDNKTTVQKEGNIHGKFSGILLDEEPSAADLAWLQQFEELIRKYIGKVDLSHSLICNELGISERALFRRVNRIAGITPSRLVRIIRLQIALELIRTGKYRTISQVSAMAGFHTPSYFSKVFEKIYGIEILKLLK